jgi:hypothetical protein
VPVFNLLGGILMIGAGENNIITESEYQSLVEFASDRTNSLYIPEILVSDYHNIENRSMLGRYLFRIQKDYTNAACVLATVAGYPMTNEDIAWGRFDIAIGCLVMCTRLLDGFIWFGSGQSIILMSYCFYLWMKLMR